MAPLELVVQGRIATFAGSAGFGWVEAIGIGQGRVIAAGSQAELDALASAGTRRLRLPSELVALPGLTDAHLHLADAALGGAELVVEGAGRWDALRLVAQAHRERGATGDHDTWLLGRGWSLDRFEGWPGADELEVAAPGRPVAIWSHDHHSRWANRTALARAGIDAATPDPPGGSIEHDAGGAPSGVLFEHACQLLDPAIPPPTAEQVAEAVRRYAQRLVELGVVGCHDPGEVTPEPALERGPVLYARLASEGRLGLRVHASLRQEQLERAAALGLRSGSGAVAQEAGDPQAVRAAGRFTVGWLKLFADGALGSRTAALLAPYADRGGEGRLLQPPEALAGLVAKGMALGIVPQVHAIGDRAVRVALDALAATPASRGGRMWARLEHVQLADAVDLPRFSALRVAASVQPSHLLSDAPAARRAWPDRLTDAYRWRSLVAMGVPVPFGTDAPVEEPDPWPGIAVAVTRRRQADTAPFPGDESLRLARALRAAALDPVLAAGEEGRGGRLTPGHRADLIVLPAAALREPVRPAGALAACRPVLTLIDGEEVFRARSLDL
ncbi:MAG: amidohydrolase [Candidatus Limnocylindrales bacterium]